MESKIEILIRQNRMLMQQLLRISEDLELAQEKIAKLEKSECTGWSLCQKLKACWKIPQVQEDLKRKNRT